MDYRDVCELVGRLWLESQARDREREKERDRLQSALAEASAQRDELLRLMAGQAAQDGGDGEHA